MARAVGLLARREHSRVELGRKLQRYLEPGQDCAEIDKVLDALAAQSLLSDARYATMIVRQRAERYGDRRIANDLRERGVGADKASQALAGVHGTELPRALSVWAKRFDALPTTREERGRQGRYLQARGFSMEVIQRVLAGRGLD